MAHTKTPASAPDIITPEPVPDPPTQDVARPSPVLAWPSEWPVPELPAQKERRRSRGLPMAPVLAGAGNGTTLIATAAYSAGGPAAAAAAGAVVAAGAAAAVLRRRASVRRGMASRTGGGTAMRSLRSGGGSGLRSGSAGGTGRAGSGVGRGLSGGRGGAGSGTRSGLNRSGATPSQTSSSSGGGPARRSGTSGGGKPGGGLLRKSLGRHASPDRSSGPAGSATGPQQKHACGATDKAVKKALKRAAKDLAAKTNAAPSSTLKAAAGRAARDAWNASRPHLARAARHTAGVLADGLRAAGAGVWAWLRHRDPKAALDRLKTVWRRLRKNRATPDPEPAPVVADTVRRPTHPQPTPPSGGTVSGGHHFVAAAAEMARAAAAYQPTGMLQVGQDFTGLEEALRIHAEALKTTVENADANWPLHPNIIELMRQIHGLQLKAAELASELKPAFTQLHDVDIARLENPRQGERMWDVTSNL